MLFRSWRAVQEAEWRALNTSLAEDYALIDASANRAWVDAQARRRGRRSFDFAAPSREPATVTSSGSVMKTFHRHFELSENTSRKHPKRVDSDNGIDRVRLGRCRRVGPALGAT